MSFESENLSDMEKPSIKKVIDLDHLQNTVFEYRLFYYTEIHLPNGSLATVVLAVSMKGPTPLALAAATLK